MGFPKTPYTCPRCGYETYRKGNMEKHLLLKKRLCPNVNEVVLSEEVIAIVLKDRIYHPPKPPNNVINQQINNIQCIQNFVSGLSPLDKIKAYCEYKDIETTNFEESLENKYGKIVQRLGNDNYKYGYKLSSTDLLDIINETSLSDGRVESLNIFFDEKSNKLRVFLDEWSEFFIDPGLEKVLLCLKEYYLDHYEEYLYRQRDNTQISIVERKKYDELIEEYYRFLITFNIKPCNDDEGYEKYNKIKEKLLVTEKKELYKRVITIIKTNSKQNIDNLNSKIVNLFHMDKEFKDNILKNLITVV